MSFCPAAVLGGFVVVAAFAAAAAAVDVVIGIGVGGTGATVDVSFFENKFRIPPKKLDFFVVGVGVVVVAERTNFSPSSACAYDNC